MKVSYDWLQTFFDTKLPSPETIAERITFGAFEIEEIQEAGDDTVFDIKVLPDRAASCLSHRGIAREIATLCEAPLTRDPFTESIPELMPIASNLSVTVLDTKAVPFYGAAYMQGVKVGPSPEWLRERLEAIGQRSINNIVDATNYVMFELGSPLHAFDAKKLTGDTKSICVRGAKMGEKITVLGGTEYSLTEEMSVIADGASDAPLAIAGVKGGIVAEVDEGTVDIVIEGALFNAIKTRTTSQALHLRTDASHRFENGVAGTLPAIGLVTVVQLIRDIAAGELIGYAHTPIPVQYEFKLGVSAEEVNRRLGTALQNADIDGILTKLGFTHNIVDPIAQVLGEAPKYVGVPYKLGASVLREAPHAFDCSSFSSWLYAQAGISIPRISIDQYVWADVVEEGDLQPGDLIFSNAEVGNVWTESQEFVPGTPEPRGISHLGIYLGEGNVIHATTDLTGTVMIQKLTEASRFNDGKIVGYRRVAKAGEKRFVVSVPFERLDLRDPANLIEEIGRVYGYLHVPTTSLPASTTIPAINKNVYAMEYVRGLLEKIGFTEIMTYSLREEGELALQNALASDKSHLREALTPAMKEALDKNEYYLPLTGGTDVKLYEIGRVFKKDEESINVALGVRAATGKKKSENTKRLLEEAEDNLKSVLGTPITKEDDVLEFNLSNGIEKMTTGATEYPANPLAKQGLVYAPISPYPFVLRDIALWVEAGIDAEVVAESIRNSAGDLLVRLDQFDSFEKEGRVSYAFHLVFQSGERTLSDAEVNGHMTEVTKALQDKQWEIR